MKERELNPHKLSVMAGLNPTAVRDMLSGRALYPRYCTIEALAHALNVSPGILMKEEYGKKISLPSKIDENIDLKELTSAFAYLQNRLLELAKKSTVDWAKHDNTHLTEREKEILSLVAFGKTDNEISILLKSSKHTINMHLRSIYDKIGATNRTLAVVKALASGWVRIELPQNHAI